MRATDARITPKTPFPHPKNTMNKSLTIANRITEIEATISRITAKIGDLTQQLTELKIPGKIGNLDPDQVADRAIEIAQNRAKNAAKVEGITAAIDTLTQQLEANQAQLKSLQVEQAAIDRQRAIAESQAAIAAALENFETARATLEAAMWEMKTVAGDHDQQFRAAQTNPYKGINQWQPRSLVGWSFDGLHTVDRIERDGITTYSVVSRSIGLFSAEIEAAERARRERESQAQKDRERAIKALQEEQRRTTAQDRINLLSSYCENLRNHPQVKGYRDSHPSTPSLVVELRGCEQELEELKASLAKIGG
jgi:hypothetical protein